jgi:hypothetical protein
LASRSAIPNSIILIRHNSEGGRRAWCGQRASKKAVPVHNGFASTEAISVGNSLEEAAATAALANEIRIRHAAS